MTEGQAMAMRELATMGIKVEKLDDSPDGPMTYNYTIHTPNGQKDASVSSLIQWRDYFRKQLNEKVAHMYNFDKLSALWSDLLKDRELVLRGNELLYVEPILGLIRGSFDFGQYGFSGQIDDVMFFKLLV